MPPHSGIAPEELARAAREGLLSPPESVQGLRTSSAQPVWRIPIILVSFSDSLTRYSPTDLEHDLFGPNPTGSVSDYYQWVSGGRLSIQGRVVASVRLPNTRAYYGANSWGLSRIETPNNCFGAVWDALRMCANTVDWSEYDADHDGYVDMLWMVHAGVGGEVSQDRNNLWSITTRMSSSWRNSSVYVTEDPVPGTTNQFMRIDRFTTLPELSGLQRGAITEIGVYCHEFGHALGLPDLYTMPFLGGTIDLGPGNWSLMSSGGYGGDNQSPAFPTHMGAWPMQFLGWDKTFNVERDSTVTLPPLEGGGPIMEIWAGGQRESEHFLVENRQRLGFDRNLPAEGLIVYHVDDAMIGQRLQINSINSGETPGLRLMEADAAWNLAMNQNRGDSGDPFPGALNRRVFDDDTQPNARTFGGGLTNIALRDITPVGDDLRFQAQVEPTSWLPAVDFTDPGFDPVDAFGFGRPAGVGDDGIAYWVSSEIRGGRPQVILRSGHGAWGAPFQVSASAHSATDPVLAVLPGGDLGVVWCDDRSGRSDLYYRSRLRGGWTPERVLVSLPGECRTPALAADDHGVLSLAFQYVESGQSQVRFMRFNYFSPFGRSLAVTGSTARPGSPTIIVDRDRVAHILWADRATSPQRLWFCRYHPDSGLVGNYPLTPRPSAAQLAFSAAIDAQGGLHVVWQTSGPGSSQIHYQHRSRTNSPAPIDTIVESQGYLLQNPTVAADTAGNLHVAYESAESGTTEIRYLRFSHGRGWDAASTPITRFEDGTAVRPLCLVASDRELTIAYIQYVEEEARLRLRRRVIEAPGHLGVGEIPDVERMGLGGRPNPVRAGQELILWWAGASPASSVELFDLAGRRVGQAPLRPAGDRWRASISGDLTRSWPSGMLFARLKGAAASPLRVIVIR